MNVLAGTGNISWSLEARSPECQYCWKNRKFNSTCEREKSYNASRVSDKQSEKVNGSKSTTASEEQQLDVVSTSLPDPPADHLWSRHHQEAHKFVGSPIAASWRTYCAVRLQGSSIVCGELWCWIIHYTLLLLFSPIERGLSCLGHLWYRCCREQFLQEPAKTSGVLWKN